MLGYLPLIGYLLMLIGNARQTAWKVNLFGLVFAEKFRRSSSLRLVIAVSYRQLPAIIHCQQLRGSTTAPSHNTAQQSHMCFRMDTNAGPFKDEAHTALHKDPVRTAL
jgi:hypothetical protein